MNPPEDNLSSYLREVQDNFPSILFEESHVNHVSDKLIKSNLDGNKLLITSDPANYHMAQGLSNGFNNISCNLASRPLRSLHLGSDGHYNLMLSHSFNANEVLQNEIKSKGQKGDVLMVLVTDYSNDDLLSNAISQGRESGIYNILIHNNHNLRHKNSKSIDYSLRLPGSNRLETAPFMSIFTEYLIANVENKLREAKREIDEFSSPS